MNTKKIPKLILVDQEGKIKEIEPKANNQMVFKANMSDLKKFIRIHPPIFIRLNFSVCIFIKLNILRAYISFRIPSNDQFLVNIV